MPRVSSFVVGKGAWRTPASSPSRGARPVKWYLSSSHRGANSRNGDGTLAPRADDSDSRANDSYVYDPLFPSPSVGGAIGCVGPETTPGGVDQRSVELRN